MKINKLISLLLIAVFTVAIFTSCVSANKKDETVIRIGGLKGPTTMGMVKLMQSAKEGTAANNYDFTVVAAADELSTKLIKGELDMVAVPANLASVLYNRTEGKVQIAALNTLGVLYITEKGDNVHSVADLAGKTIYATGKGTTPEYALRYILTKSGLDPDKDVTIEWKSEATEVVAVLSSSDNGIAMLPQPFVTVAQNSVEGLRVALDLTQEWDKVSTSGRLVTGVMVVRKDFADEHPALVKSFLEEYKTSTEFTNTNTDEAAVMIENAGIVKAPIAKKAIPHCNIVCITGSEMKDAVSGYLEALFGLSPASVGGALPADDFYYENN